MSARISPPANDAVPQQSTARRSLTRKPWFAASTALIGLGAFMLMQPFSLDLFRYSFAVLLAGVIGFTIAGKLPK